MSNAISGSRSYTAQNYRFFDGALAGVDKFACVSQWQGVNFPNWREQVRIGGNATTPFSASRTTCHFDNSFSAEGLVDVYDDITGAYLGSITGSLSGGWMRFSSIGNPSNLSTTEANNQALKRFVQKANSVQRSMQGGVFVGEIKEALRMIRSPAKTLRRGLDTYLDLAKKRAIRASKNLQLTPKQRRSGNAARHKAVKTALSDTWLENAFGWQPLLSDIDSGAKALARLKVNIDRPPITRVSARGSSAFITEHPLSSMTNSPFRVTYGSRSTSEVTVQYVAGVKCSPPNARVPRELGFSPRDFLPTVWELVPWSFVADYFTNIGDMIEGWSYLTSDIAWSCRTERKIVTKVATDPRIEWTSGDSNDKRIYLYFKPGKPSIERKIVSRSVYVGSYTPSFSFEIPGFGTKWINLAALGSRSRDVSKRIRGL